MVSDRPLRLGVASYLNAVPLVHGLEADPRFSLVRDVPSRIAERLHAGEIDLGMLPSVEYAAGDYAIVPGIAIASRGPVRSVNLFHRRRLDGVRRVALDASSRTSVALAKILLRERLGHDPEYVSMGPPVEDMLASADAGSAVCRRFRPGVTDRVCPHHFPSQADRQVGWCLRRRRERHDV